MPGLRYSQQSMLKIVVCRKGLSHPVGNVTGLLQPM
jgi:hypothetical protein